MLKQFYFKQFTLALVRSLHIKTFLFQTFQFSTHFSSIWPKDRTLSGTTTPSQSGPGSDCNEKVLRFPQSSSITGASPSDRLVSYLGHSLWGGFLSICRDSVSVFYSPNWLGNVKVIGSKVGDLCRGWPEGSLFNSYYTEV